MSSVSNFHAICSQHLILIDSRLFCFTLKYYNLYPSQETVLKRHDVLHSQVVSYLNKKFAELESPNKIKVYMGHGAKAWVSDFNHPHYMAGRRAMKTGKEL